MTTLRERAIKYLQQRFPRAPVADKTLQLLDRPDGTVLKPLHLLIAHDTDAAVRQSLIAIPSLGAYKEIDHLVATMPQRLADLKAAVLVEGGNMLTGDIVHADRMLDSPKLIIYTDALHCPRADVMAAFRSAGHLIDLIHEADMHSSVFISYGGPDEPLARAINDFLLAHSVKTWFFPKDAVAGQKLHRVMSTGVANHDRVLLICSESSLNRPGVQNELERVLEREAREGGSEILIPVAIDKYVFSEWAPERRDLADQVRSRVIATFPTSLKKTAEFNAAAEKLLRALKK
jgi:hypothetical protein